MSLTARMTFARSMVVIGALLVAAPTYAGLYKCSKNGQVSYQEAPCEGAGTELNVSVSPGQAMIGCYEMELKGRRGVKDATKRFSIKNAGGGNYEFVDLEQAQMPPMTLRAATRMERDALGKGLGLSLTDGVTLDWKGDVPNQKPAGIYKGKDKTGADIYLGHFLLREGFGKKIPCP